MPRYIRGRHGRVQACLGTFLNPEELAFGNTAGRAVPLYHVRFEQIGVWAGYTGAPHDAVLLEIPEHWLQEERPS